MVRGTFGRLLREMAPEQTYRRLFEPGSSGPGAPSGLADWPRPFVLRAAHLDGTAAESGAEFFIDVHLFQVPDPPLALFEAAFREVAVGGLGPARARARLETVARLDLAHGVIEAGCGPSVIPLDAAPGVVNQIVLRFVTPTELKGRGTIAQEPEFGVLFGRIRDRISTLRALYGAGPLDIDFRGMGERARQVRLVRSGITWEYASRRSGRDGLAHPLGGFTGDACYEGELSEFLPWLRAARWTGVGRQTVWGKGEVRILTPA